MASFLTKNRLVRKSLSIPRRGDRLPARDRNGFQVALCVALVPQAVILGQRGITPASDIQIRIRSNAEVGAVHVGVGAIRPRDVIGHSFAESPRQAQRSSREWLPAPSANCVPACPADWDQMTSSPVVPASPKDPESSSPGTGR